MNKNTRNVMLSALALVLLVLSGCAAPKPAGLTDQQVAEVTENTLKALEANDYQQFTRDYSEQMNAAFSQEKFDSLRSLLQTSSGNYISLGAPSMSNNQGYAVYRFEAKYTNETVFVTITFLIGGSKIEGEFFDSVNLRKASQ
jgi:hypothetical protein